MKKILPIATGISFLGFIISLILLFQADYGLSLPFKLTFIFLSASLATFSFWKSGNSLIIGIVALISFIGTIIILFNTKLYLDYWHNVLSLHVLLIGITLYNMTRSPLKHIFFKITQVVIIITTLLFFLALTLKLENNLLFTALLALLLITTILFIISQIIGIAKNNTK